MRRNGVPVDSDIQEFETMTRKFLILFFLCGLLAMPFAATAQEHAPLSAEDQKRFDYFFLEAVNSKLKQDYATAYELLKHALTIHPHSGAAHYEMSQYHLLLGEPQQGILSLEKAVENDPDNYWYAQGLANLYLQQGQEEKATAFIEEMAARFPTHIELQLTLETLYVRSEQYEKAIQVLNTLEQKRGKNEQLTMEKFRIYRQMKQDEHAFKEIESLIEEYPADLHYQVILGDAYMQMGEDKKAYEIYRQVLQKEPNNTAALYSIASYYEFTDQQDLYESTLDALLMNKEVDDGVKLNVMRRLVIQAEQQERDSTQIINRFERVLQHDAENADLTMLYVQYLMAKDMNREAQPVLKRLLEIDPTNNAGRMMMLSEAASAENYPEIIALCESGIDASPEVLEFYYYLAIAYAHEQQNDKVILTCQSALEHTDEESNPEMVSDFYSMLGDIYHTEGQTDKAYESYEKALEFNAQNISVLNNYAYYLSLEKKDLDRAEEMSFKTVKAEPQNGTYLDTYAWVLFVKGNYTQAKLYIDMAMEAEGEKSADVVEHCGDIYFKTGYTEEAIQYWRQAAELGSESTTLKKKISQKKYIEP